MSHQEYITGGSNINNLACGGGNRVSFVWGHRHRGRVAKMEKSIFRLTRDGGQVDRVRKT